MEEYNTMKNKLNLPEYGRSVQQMVQYLKTIPDKAKRSEQAKAVINVMEILNPQVHNQENYEHKLWDHLFVIADYDLDIDSPYPAPQRAERERPPMPLSVEKSKIKATHYGRNIIGMIDLVAALEDSPVKTDLIKGLAVYMRQQYLIWNKDNVSDETIFEDIEKLSDYKIKVPEGLELGRINPGADYSRPGIKSSGNQKKRFKKKK